MSDSSQLAFDICLSVQEPVQFSYRYTQGKYKTCAGWKFSTEQIYQLGCEFEL